MQNVWTTIVQMAKCIRSQTFCARARVVSIHAAYIVSTFKAFCIHVVSKQSNVARLIQINDNKVNISLLVRIPFLSIAIHARL